MPIINRGIWRYDPQTVKEAGRTRRAGWWFWYPLLFGIAFGVLGVVFLAAGLGITAIPLLVVAAVSIGIALWIRRDIARPDPTDEDANRRVTRGGPRATR